MAKTYAVRFWNGDPNYPSIEVIGPFVSGKAADEWIRNREYNPNVEWSTTEHSLVSPSDFATDEKRSLRGDKYETIAQWNKRSLKEERKRRRELRPA